MGSIVGGWHCGINGCSLVVDQQRSDRTAEGILSEHRPTSSERSLQLHEGHATPLGSSGQKRKLLDEYTVGETLGEGAFGVVYACQCIATGTDVAVKMVDKVETPQIEIKKEVDMLMSLNHPNIVKFHQVFYERCFVCIVMDKFQGGDLVEGMQRHWKSRGKIRCHSVCHVCVQIARSVHYLHTLMIVHRDIKGDNYLMDRVDLADAKCNVALSDFGTAYKMKRLDEVLRDAVGTKVFWAPEFYDAEYGLPVDIFAVGVVLYGLLDGRFPFRDEADVKKGKALRFPKDVAPACEDMVKKMLERTAKKRITAEQLMQHPWITNAGGDVDGSVVPTDAASDVPAGNNGLRESGADEAVTDRRRELVERLEACHKEAAEALARANSVQTYHDGCSSVDSTQTVPNDEPYWANTWTVAGNKRGSAGVAVQMEWWEREKVIEHGVLQEAFEPKSPRRSGGSKRLGKDAQAAPPKSATPEVSGIAASSDKKSDAPEARVSVCYQPLRTAEERPDVVGKMLVDHGIDVSKFGEGHAKSLLQLSMEVTSGAARLMLDATQHKTLVRVVDVVLLRITASVNHQGERYLIETSEKFSDGRGREVNRLPGAKKEPHENTRNVADKILKEKLNMSDCQVAFDFRAREVFEDESESLSYPGVRTVYRKEIVHGRVTTADPLVLKRVGLPGGSTWSAIGSDGDTKFLSWLNEQQCIGQEVRIRAPKTWEDVSGLVPAPIGLNEQDLLAYLQKCNVDVAKFGKDRSHSLKDFSVELIRGESSIMEDKDGRAIRVVDLVCLKLVNSSTGGILVQTEQVYPDGKKVSLNRLPAAKRRPDENQFLTARRVLRKQLRIDENQVAIDADAVQIIEEEKESPSYPGLRTVYRKRIVAAELSRISDVPRLLHPVARVPTGSLAPTAIPPPVTGPTPMNSPYGSQRVGS